MKKLNILTLAIENRLSGLVPCVNPFLYWTDSYKVSHIDFEIDGVSGIYSNATARFGKYMEEMLGKNFSGDYVVFGIQWMMSRFHMMAKTGFFDRDVEDVIKEMSEVHGNYIGNENFDHFRALHGLGYIPIRVKSVDEGIVLPIGMPFYTIENTLPEFEWLANYLESGMSTDIWKQTTVATVAYAFRKISNKYAMETQGNTDGVEYQNHDFSTRGQGGFESGAINGCAFLLSSSGTDNLPSLWAAKNFYDSVNTEFGSLASSVPAGEHSVTTLGILTTQRRAALNGEDIDITEAERRYTSWVMTEKFKKGIVSYVADSFDYWSFIDEILPSLYDEVMGRDGKFVVRGDSGDPVHIISGYRIRDLDQDEKITGRFRKFEELRMATHVWWVDGTEVVKFKGEYFKLNTEFFDNGVLKGLSEKVISRSEAVGTIERLWEIFGGTVNDLGYKHLDSHIGMIYGDSINVHRSVEILSRLKERGFASTNIVFGVGSYSLNMLSRDHLGMAIKATNATVEIGDEIIDTPIYKEPSTDMSKKSDRGFIVLDRDSSGKVFKLDMQSREDMMSKCILTDMYVDGNFVKFTTIEECRDRLWHVPEIVGSDKGNLLPWDLLPDGCEGGEDEECWWKIKGD